MMLPHSIHVGPLVLPVFASHLPWCSMNLVWRCCVVYASFQVEYPICVSVNGLHLHQRMTSLCVVRSTTHFFMSSVGVRISIQSYLELYFFFQEGRSIRFSSGFPISPAFGTYLEFELQAQSSPAKQLLSPVSQLQVTPRNQ